jgi:pre-rRNA-processing protein TSR2
LKSLLIILESVSSSDKYDPHFHFLLTYFFLIDGKKLDIDEIEDILSQIMTDEFHTTLEDDSPYLVAKHLVNLFNQCINGNFSEVERLRERAKAQNSFVASSCVKQGDDDSDDEDNVSYTNVEL